MQKSVREVSDEIVRDFLDGKIFHFRGYTLSFTGFDNPETPIYFLGYFIAEGVQKHLAYQRRKRQGRKP